jgi:DNA-binding GntR family transcriptional regulator
MGVEIEMARKLERPAPPYLQIAEAIREQIRGGDLSAGQRVPSVRDITRQYDVAMATAHRAMRVLQSEGYIRPEPGLGNVVTSEAERGWSASAWLERSRHTGRVYPDGQHARILEAALVEAPEQVVGALGLNAGDMAVKRVRITYHGEKPVSCSTSWFPGDVAGKAPKLLERSRIHEGTFAYLAGALGRQMSSWQDQYEAGLASAADAKRLGIAEGTPVQLGRNWVYDEVGGVLEYGESVSAGRITYRGDITD